MTTKLNLPRELKDFEETIRSTARPFIKILPQKSAETNWWQSKIGGKPYLPKNATYPVDLEGNQLFFLTQINFEETPSLSPFPSKGILQFYIFDDPFYGMEINDPFSQDGFRVVYYEQLIEDENQLVTDFSFLRNFMPDPIDNLVSYPLKFQLDEEFVPTVDYHFDEQFGEDFFYQFGEKEWELWQDYNQNIKSAGHKLGGYAHFTQEDPRYNQSSPLQLLFQLDSDSNIRCNWGDMGIANFFITTEELKNKDFSRVFYNWDSP
jgi:uncharacterized protein YwqG